MRTVRARRARRWVSAIVVASACGGEPQPAAPGTTATVQAQRDDLPGVEPRGPKRDVAQLPSLSTTRSRSPEVIWDADEGVARIGSISWNPQVVPATVPTHSLHAVLAGDIFEPADAVWTHSDGAVQLGFFRDPQLGCSFHWFREHGFSIRLGSDVPREGERFERIETLPMVAVYDSPSEVPDRTGMAEIQRPGPRPGTRTTNLAGAVLVEIESFDDVARGRVYVASRGDDRSLLVGAFTARHCPAVRAPL
jgi:hypothetical protein